MFNIYNFIVSDGDKGSKSQVIGADTPCEIRRDAEIIEKLPNIPTQVELGDKFQQSHDLILLQNPDSLKECDLGASECIRKLEQNQDTEIFADYTGGTKTMSAALVLAAIDCGIPLYLTVAGARENLIKFERGESTQQVDTNFRHV
ncbi:MAG: hypothetical protein IGS39_07970 [Calothrix sp. C42_A2020_038]|nr:hypothetical protein [Calothrix sp. C42_A2020_038]